MFYFSSVSVILTRELLLLYNYDSLTTFPTFPSDDCAHYMKLKVTNF